MQIHISGIENVTAMLDNFANRLSVSLEHGLAQGCEIVKAEAKANCPVSTEKTRAGGPHGELRASITSQVEGNVGIVGTNKEYGIYVELGTCKMAAQPFLVPALKNKQGEVVEAIANEFKG